MTTKLKVNVHHLTRVEGHGNIKIRVENGEIKEARWDVVETPRYFEAMLQGKHYTTAGILTARICGICSIGHCLASIRATEQAFGITIPDIAQKLRLLAKHGETLQSHILHLFFLAAPDFLGLPNVLPLIEKKPEVVNLALQLKNLANRLCDLVAGRTTHPVTLQVGGIKVRPDNKKLLALRVELSRSILDLEETVKLFRTFEIPDFSRETEFVSLKGNNDYPFIGGRLFSSDGVEKAESDYRTMTNEFVDENNTSKWCKLSRDSFAVGALARFNNNHQFLHNKALEIAWVMGLEPVCHNPYFNNVAQLVECVHVVLDAIRLIDDIVKTPKDVPTMTPVEPAAGEGVGAVEVPRGILYHHYEYDHSGRIIRANCVIPTTQNNLNIHLDLHELVKKYATPDMTDEKLELLSSMLVRAYDPCISCSVH